MRVVRANAEARDARGNLDPPQRGRGELGQPSNPHPSPTATDWQRLDDYLEPGRGHEKMRSNKSNMNLARRAFGVIVEKHTRNLRATFGLNFRVRRHQLHSVGFDFS